MRWFAAAAVLVVLAGSAEARQHYPARGHRILPGTPSPLDGFTAPAGAYSFRKLRSAYTGPALRIRRASDNAEVDINFLGCTTFTGCPWDEATAGGHCASTTCFSARWYDQSGLAQDLQQATAGNQPQLIFNCNGALPCLRMTASTQQVVTVASVTPATGVVSLSAVAKRSGGTGPCTWIRFNGSSNRLSATSAVANGWNTFATSGLTTTAATDGVWHSGQGVNNGASSVINIDGAEITGTTGAATLTAGTMGTLGGTSATCDVAEAVVWDNVANDAAARAVLRNNQKNFFGTP